MRADKGKWARLTQGRKRFLYFLYAGAWICFFLYRLFPSEQVTAYLSDRLAVAAPGYTAAIGSLKPVFPPALRAGTVDLMYRRQPVLRIEEVRIAPRLEGIIKWRPYFSFKGKACGGRFEGRSAVERSGGRREAHLNLTVVGIDLEKVPRLKELTGHGISGSLEGQAALTTVGPTAETMTAEIVVTGAVIDTPAAVMSVRRLRFSRVAADLALERGTLLVHQCSFSGPQMDGDIAGTIAVKRPIGASRLALTGSARPHAEFLATIQGSQEIPSGLLKIIGLSGFSFRFSGSYDMPAVSLAPGGTDNRS